MGKQLKRFRSTLHYWIVDPWMPDEDGGGDARKQPSKAANTNTKNKNKKDKASKKSSKGADSKTQTTKANFDTFTKNVLDNIPFRNTLRRASKTFHYWVIDPWLPEIEPDPPARYRAPNTQPSITARLLSLIGIHGKPEAAHAVPRPTVPAAKTYTIRRYGSVESVASVLTEYHVAVGDGDRSAGSLNNYLLCEEEIVGEVTDTLDDFRTEADGLATFGRHIETVCNDIFKVTVCPWPAHDGEVVA